MAAVLAAVWRSPSPSLDIHTLLQSIMLRAVVLALSLPSVASLRVTAAPAAHRLAVSATSQPTFALRAAEPRMAEKEEVQDKDNMMQQVKDAGVAGIISYVFWEWAFWGVSVPVCIFGYREARKHGPYGRARPPRTGAQSRPFALAARRR